MKPPKGPSSDDSWEVTSDTNEGTPATMEDDAAPVAGPPVRARLKDPLPGVRACLKALMLKVSASIDVPHLPDWLSWCAAWDAVPPIPQWCRRMVAMIVFPLAIAAVLSEEHHGQKELCGELSACHGETVEVGDIFQTVHAFEDYLTAHQWRATVLASLGGGQGPKKVKTNFSAAAVEERVYTFLGLLLNCIFRFVPCFPQH